MGIIGALLESLNKNKKWILIGAVLYLLPVSYRLITENSVVPFLDATIFLRQSGSQINPVNLETLGLTFIIPTAVGAVVGVSFLENTFNRRFSGFEKYLARIFGSVSLAFLWISLHFIGSNFFNILTPWGSNLFAGTTFYVRNLIIALTISPIVPYVVELIHKFIRKS